MELIQKRAHQGLLEKVFDVFAALHVASQVYVDHAYARPWLKTDGNPEMPSKTSRRL